MTQNADKVRRSIVRVREDPTATDIFLRCAVFLRQWVRRVVHRHAEFVDVFLGRIEGSAGMRRQTAFTLWWWAVANQVRTLKTLIS